MSIRSTTVLALVFSYMFASSSLCAYAKSAEDTAEEERVELRKKIEERKTELNGSSWQILIKSQAGKGSLEGPDTLTFQDGKFSSEALSKKNYSRTNYTLTIQEGGPTIWETMQTSEKDGVTFFRGEWLKDTMTGVITRQTDKGSEDYYFSSSAMKKISPTSTEVEGAEPETVDTSSADAKTGGAIFVTGGEAELEASAPQGASQKPKEKTSWFF